MVLLCVGMGLAEAGAQEGSPSPHTALDRLVYVQAASGAKSAGVIFGSRQDSVFIVTTRHTVRDTHDVTVQVTQSDSAHKAEVRYVSPDRDLDFAVIAFPASDIRGVWRLPTAVRPRPSTLDGRTTLYAIGCAPGCWWPPLGVRYSHSIISTYSDGSQLEKIYVRGEYLEPGFSGGPLVDPDGAVLGMITSTGSAVGSAIFWRDLVATLEACGFPVNLSSRRGLRSRSVFVRIAGDLFPIPGRDSDGAPLFGGGRLQAGVVLTGLNELVVGMDRMSFAGGHIPAEQGAQKDAVVLHYMFVGYRARTQLPLLRLPQPSSMSIGADLLIPWKAWSVASVPGDSVDVRNGERVPSLETITLDSRVSASVIGDVRINLSEQVGLNLELAAFFPRLPNWRTNGYIPRLSIGVDHRWAF